MSLHFSSGTANRLIRKKKTWWQPFRSIKQWLYIFKLTGILTLGYWYFVFGCRALWSDAKAGKSVCDRTVCTLIHTVCKFTVLLWVNFVPLYSLIGAEEEQMKVAESPLRTGEKQERRNMDRNHGRVGLRSGGVVIVRWHLGLLSDWAGGGGRVTGLDGIISCLTAFWWATPGYWATDQTCFQSPHTLIVMFGEYCRKKLSRNIKTQLFMCLREESTSLAISLNYATVTRSILVVGDQNC